MTSATIGAVGGGTTTDGTGPTFARLLAAEWTKIRSVRSTLWSLIITAVVAIGFTAIATAVTIGAWDQMTEADRAQLMLDPIGLILQPGTYYGQIAIGVLGVMVIAGEYSTGTISASLLASPRRTPLMLAKALVLAALVFVVGEIIAFVSFFLGSSIISSKVDVSLGDEGVLRAVLGFGLYLPTVALLALGIGALIRHVAGAITAVLAIVVVVPSIASLLPGKTGEYVSTYMPGGSAGQMLMSSGENPGALVTPWQGFGVAAFWAVLAVVLAVVQLRARDA